MTKTIKSIGSISEHVIRFDDKTRDKRNKKMSEQLREERELLFGPKKKRVFQVFLPMSVKDKRYMIDKSNDKDMEKVLDQILFKMNEVNSENFTLEQVRNTTEYKLKRQRMILAYIAYHCFHIKRKQVTDFFGMSHDISGCANKMFFRLFQQDMNEQERFMKVFDHFMQLNGKQYT